MTILSAGALARIAIRPATPGDAGRVGELLDASYATLLREHYGFSVLNRALPHMIRPQAALLAAGTWYLAEDRGTEAPLLGCGGWTIAAPGGGAVTPRVGHVRHVATRPDATRRGVASLILARCVADAAAAGLEALECLSTLTAEPFYVRAGFAQIGATSVPLGGAVEFPAIRMRLRLGPVVDSRNPG